MTSDVRSAASNGIWLCQYCAKLIDSEEDAWTIEGLQAWKRHREAQAAKESRATEDEIGDLINRIDTAVTRTYEFAAAWEQKEYSFHFRPRRNMSEEERERLWHEETELIIERSKERSAAYHSEIVPLTTDILIRTEIILGPENEHLERAKQSAIGASTNYFSIREMAERLTALKTILQLQ